MKGLDAFMQAIKDAGPWSPSFPVSAAALEAYWRWFADQGPRHKNVARWRHVFGWKIDPKAEAAYLAPERKGW